MTQMLIGAAAAAILAAPAVSRAQAAKWTDPTPHTVRFITVDKGVDLEVLDWGGSGRPVVLLAGSGLSAHVYDELAPKLTDCCHVYGITRRGYGASTQPASGYDNQRLADDVLRVIEVLDLERPVLVGHSAAGGELTTLGHQHSDRISALVYLDALGDGRDWPASDPAYMALLRKLPPGPPPPSCPDDGTPAGSWAALKCRMKLPEPELHSVFATNGDGSAGAHKTPGWVHEAFGDGDIKRDYSRIRVPVLALFEFPRTSLDQLRPDEPHPKNEEEAQNLLAFAQAHKAFVDRWVANLKRGVADARVVDLPAAGHFVFLTKEADVLREIHALIGRLAVARGVESGMFEPGVLRARWTPESADCAGVPPFFVHEYNPTFLILRQSGCTNFEKPFLYLILGSKEAMLVDTGAEGADVSAAVRGLLRGLPLVVVHSHGHSDHVAGDAAFRGREGVRLVERAQSAVAAFFGLADWPQGVAQYDLGDRVLDVFPIPGHEVASIAIYDRRTGILLTGDALYPGRLYVRDAAAYRASIDRMVAFTAAHDVTHILGAHIENTRTPYLDYPEGTTFQPDEHALELGRAHLLELQAALREMDGPIVRRRLRDFTIWPVTPR